jgi:hypothetical protein
MDDRLLLALGYTVPGGVVALIALRAGLALSTIYKDLVAKATEAGRDVPPLVTLYFKHTAWVLLATGVLYLALLASDAVLSRLAYDRTLMRVFGFAGGIVLLVCGFALLMQGMADRQLQLQPKWWRRAYIACGVAGISLAGYGMALVAWHDSVWAG